MTELEAGGRVKVVKDGHHRLGQVGTLERVDADRLEGVVRFDTFEEGYLREVFPLEALEKAYPPESCTREELVAMVRYLAEQIDYHDHTEHSWDERTDAQEAESVQWWIDEAYKTTKERLDD